MTPVTTRAANSISIEMTSAATGEGGQSDVSDSFGSVLLAGSVFLVPADAGRDPDSSDDPMIEEARAEGTVSNGSGLHNAVVLHEILETGIIVQHVLERKDSGGAGQSNVVSPTLLVPSPGQVPDQPKNSDSAIYISELVLADAPAANLPVLPQNILSLLASETSKLAADTPINSLFVPLSGDAERSQSVSDRVVSVPLLAVQSSAAAGVSPLAAIVSKMSFDADPSENPGISENSKQQTADDAKTAPLSGSRIDRAPQADDHVSGDVQSNTVDSSDGNINQNYEPSFLAGFIAPQLPKTDEPLSKPEPPFRRMPIQESKIDAKPDDRLTMLPMMETRAAAEMIRPKDVFSSVTAEQKQTLVSLAPPEKDHIQSASAMVDRVDRPPQPVAPMAAVSAIGLGFREVDEDEGIGKQTVTFNATPANEKTARTAINADDKQSGPDTATGAASERSRAGASFSVSAQEKRPDRQSDAVPDVKSAAAANPLPIEPLPTPAQQIISGLTQQYARLEPVQVSGRQITEAEPDPMARGGIKILRIRLQPETLGEVEVTLRRAGSEVKVGLLVGSEATAATLRQDLGTLQDRLISSLLGDTTPVIEITVRDQALQSQGQYLQGAGPGSGYNLTGGNDTGSNRRPSSDRDANSFSSERGEDDEQMDSDRRSYSGLVV